MAINFLCYMLVCNILSRRNGPSKCETHPYVIRMLHIKFTHNATLVSELRVPNLDG